MSDEIRVGDRFEITVEVVRFYGSGDDRRCLARPDGAPADEINDIAESTLLSGRRLPRARVGDRVRTALNRCGVILAIYDDDSWVKWSDGSRDVILLGNLTPILGDEK